MLIVVALQLLLLLYREAHRVLRKFALLYIIHICILEGFYKKKFKSTIIKAAIDFYLLKMNQNEHDC